MRTSEMELDAEQIERGYKALLEVERGWRDLKQLDLRPVCHRKDDRIIAHVQLSWLALLIIRTAETATGDSWRNLSAELNRSQLHTYATGHGTVSQCTSLTANEFSNLERLRLPDPPRCCDSTPLNDRPHTISHHPGHAAV